MYLIDVMLLMARVPRFAALRIPHQSATFSGRGWGPGLRELTRSSPSHAHAVRSASRGASVQVTILLYRLSGGLRQPSSREFVRRRQPRRRLPTSDRRWRSKSVRAPESVWSRRERRGNRRERPSSDRPPSSPPPRRGRHKGAETCVLALLRKPLLIRYATPCRWAGPPG